MLQTTGKICPKCVEEYLSIIFSNETPPSPLTICMKCGVAWHIKILEEDFGEGDVTRSRKEET